MNTLQQRRSLDDHRDKLSIQEYSFLLSLLGNQEGSIIGEVLNVNGNYRNAYVKVSHEEFTILMSTLSSIFTPELLAHVNNLTSPIRKVDTDLYINVKIRDPKLLSTTAGIKKITLTPGVYAGYMRAGRSLSGWYLVGQSFTDM